MFDDTFSDWLYRGFTVAVFCALGWAFFAVAGIVSFGASGPLCPPSPAGVSADQCPTCRAGCPYCPLGSDPQSP